MYILIHSVAYSNERLYNNTNLNMGVIRVGVPGWT